MRSVKIATPDNKLYVSTTLFPIFTHRVKTDFETGRFDRPYLPMVYVFDENKTTVTKEWQMYLVAINYGMRANNIAHILNDDVAFCNNSGLAGDHHRRN